MVILRHYAHGMQDTDRQERLRAMALCDAAALTTAWETMDPRPEHRAVKGPETGLVMLRGRIGGGGAPFNVGEATMTRCVVQLASGEVGFGHTLGRDAKKAETMALFDALAQVPGRAGDVDEALAPLTAARVAAEEARAAEVAGTRVEFFTMARGD